MRLSVDINDDGWSPAASKYKAYLDGEELLSCITADEELGCAIVNRQNNCGEYIINVITGRIKRKKVYGVINIVEVV